MVTRGAARARLVVAEHRQRPRWPMFSVGVTVVVLMIVCTVVVVHTSAATGRWLAVRRPVLAGAVLTDGDLSVVRLPATAALRPVPAARRGRVVGRHALVDLLPGTLLTVDQVGDWIPPARGRHLVGIELGAGRRPARPLRAGAAVLLVVVPDPPAAVDPAVAGVGPQTFAATIVAVTEADSAGRVRVDVSVADTDGPTVAVLAAAGRLTVVATAGSRS